MKASLRGRVLRPDRHGDPVRSIRRRPLGHAVALGQADKFGSLRVGNDPLDAAADLQVAVRPAGIGDRQRHGGFTHPPLSPLAVNDPAVQAAQLPAVNGVASARSLAKIFAAVIGEVDGIRLLSPRAMECARRERVRGPDLAAVGMTESALGLGFNLPTAARPLGGPGSFGSVGLGGCRAWALPEAALAFGYLPNQLQDVNPDPRDVALTSAALAARGN